MSLYNIQRPFAVLAALAALSVALPASAAVTLTFTGTDDNAFEGPGGYLNAVRGLPLVPPANATALPPIERAVGQVRQAGDRRALHMPTAATGLPVADGGTGVTNALTNVSPFAASGLDFGNGEVVPFSISRIGNIVNFTFGTVSLNSDARSSIGEINAIEFRIRTQATSPSLGPNSIVYSNILFNDTATVNQVLPGFTTADGGVLILLYEGIAPGDFSFSGSITQNWTAGQRPGGSALATQLKLLVMPPIPEPGTWAMMIAGFGMVGAAMRRRRIAIA